MILKAGKSQGMVQQAVWQHGRRWKSEEMSQQETMHKGEFTL
jgi:hypothetical protein